MHVPSALTFWVTGSEAAKHEVTVYPISGVSTCHCRFGSNYPQGMVRSRECYHAKAAWKLVERDGA